MIIVTGGAGFIGSCLVAGLQEKYPGQRVVVCDTLGEDDKWRNIAKREIYDFVMPQDFFPYLMEYADDIKMIFHLGAISSTMEKDADLIMESNFVLTRELWRFCGNNNIRLVYASSAATYGDGEDGFNDVEQIHELADLKPLNPYGWSKHVFDRYVARVTQDSALKEVEPVPPQYAGLKFFNVYGPNEYHKGGQMSVVCKLYPTLEDDGEAILFKSHKEGYEDGGQMRDFVYVKDCVDVMLWLMDNPDVSGLFNVGTGKARSFSDLAQAIFAALEKEPQVTYVDMPEELQQQYQYFTQANMDKLRKAGYTKGFTSLEDGVRDYVVNYMARNDKYY